MVSIDELRRVPLFAHLTDAQLASIPDGTEILLRPGDRVATEGDPPSDFCVVLGGRLEWTKKVGAQEVHVLYNEPGMFYGHLSLLADMPYPMSGRAMSETRLYSWGTEEFWHMLSICPSITRRIFATTAQRWQTVQGVSEQQAKLASLGTMAAGLSHELNNPAAAVGRGVRQLGEVIQRISSHALALQQWPLTSTQRAFLSTLPDNLRASPAGPSALDPLTRGDREDDIVAWLDRRGVAEGWHIAPVLMEAGLDTDWLDTLAANIPSDALEDVLRWAEARAMGDSLVGEIAEGSSRISALVAAVKDYSHMDRAPEQDVDIRDGLESTLTILGYKLAGGGVSVLREYDPDLPRVPAHGSALNQVWTNLLDNAIDALGGTGHIWIRTWREPGRAVVEIADDGPGIPAAVQPHIFEPFFTTKEVGKGSGLGLDISYRIVTGTHRGDIRVQSTPGDTRFQVRLPLTPSPED